MNARSLVICAIMLMLFFSSSSITSAYEKDPFDPRVQDYILAWTAEQMNIKLDDTIPKPVVVLAEEVSDEEFHELIGMNTGSKRTNFFSPPSTIYLTLMDKNDNLAHELVHYMQYNYSGQKNGLDPALEYQAVDIQLVYKDEHKKEP